MSIIIMGKANIAKTTSTSMLMLLIIVITYLGVKDYC